ncbi:hypothetical protein BKA70DRAFT_1257121 [Coprinopsis sp. MPI-PUGE-AT-0042]|nr:hypothetical protein BKA70DRAFT_1257121 [Coprinopsis sp. MPI-PUGE-AT-0042]
MFPPPSGFEKHFSTNYAASDVEIAAIKQLLQSIASETAQLDAQIEYLARRREALWLYGEEHRALVSHIRTLPTDVLATIFLECLPTERNAIMSTQDAPLALTQVCQRWRHLSLCTPLLWARVHIVFPFHPEASSSIRKTADENWHRRMKGREELLGLWLSRSQQCPLSLSIMEGTGDRSQGNSGMHAHGVVETILQHSARWKSLDLWTTPFLARILLALSPSRTPNLHNFKLKEQYPLVSPPFPSTQNDIGPDATSLALFTPSLRSLSLRPVPHGVMRLPIRWETLTSLKIEAERFGGIGSAYFDAQSALLVLEKARDLEDCTLAIQDYWDIHSPPSIPTTSAKILLANLRQFEIGPMSIACNQIIERLDLPTLKSLSFSLSFSNPEEEDTLNTSPLLLAMRQWGHTIASIEFDCANVSPKVLQTFFEMADNIQQLSLFLRSHRNLSPLCPSQELTGGSTVNEGVLLALTPSFDRCSGGGVLLPNLSSLHIGISKPELEFDVRPMAEFIAARRDPRAQAEGIACLEQCEVFFGFQRPFHGSDLEETSKLLEGAGGGNLDGLKLEMVWRYCSAWGPGSYPTDLLWDPALGADMNLQANGLGLCRGPSCQWCH